MPFTFFLQTAIGQKSDSWLQDECYVMGLYIRVVHRNWKHDAAKEMNEKTGAVKVGMQWGTANG